MFATRRRSFGSPTRAEALVLGQNCASLVTKITILYHTGGPLFQKFQTMPYMREANGDEG